MKNYKKILLLLLIVPLVFFWGCKDDEGGQSDQAPSIVLSTTRASLNKINLNSGTGPNIRGWAVAPAGLATVNITAATGSGNKVLLNVDSFTAENSEKNGTAYEFDVYPEYTADFKSITITVTDSKGRSTDMTPYEVEATGGESGPSYEGFAARLDANIRPEVNIIPVVKGTVKSHWGLKSVSLFEVYGETEEKIEDVKDFGETPNAYIVNKTPNYEKGLTDGMTAFKILAEDGRGFTSSLIIPVTIIDAPEKPKVEFDAESIEADLKASPAVKPTISGRILSTSGLKSVSFYVDAPGGDALHGSELTSFDDAHEYDFDFDDIPYALGVKGFKVVAEDNDGQITTEVLPIKVIVDDPNLIVFNNVEIYGAGVRFDQPSAFSFEDGNVYMYDQEPVNDVDVAKSIYFIATATGNGDPLYDIMSPTESWLGNNYYKGVEWAYENNVQLRLLDVGELDFDAATSLDLAALPHGETTTRARQINGGSGTVLFVSEEGVKGLIHFVSSEENPGSHKNDKMTFNIKVLK